MTKGRAQRDCVTNLMLNSHCVPRTAESPSSAHIVCSNFSYPNLGRREKEAHGCRPPSAEHDGASESSLFVSLLSRYKSLEIFTDVLPALGFRSKRAFPKRQGSRPSALLLCPLRATHWKVEPDRSPLGLWSLFMSLDTFSLCMPSRLARRINRALHIPNE